MMLGRTAQSLAVLRHRWENFEDEANNMQLVKEDTQRIYLNSEYLSATLV